MRALGEVVGEGAADEFGPDPPVADEVLGGDGGEAVAEDVGGEVAVCGVEAEHGGVGDFDAVGFGGVVGEEEEGVAVVVFGGGCGGGGGE